MNQVYTLDLSRTQDASHHQDDITFLEENISVKLHLPLAYWVAGRSNVYRDSITVYLGDVGIIDATKQGWTVSKCERNQSLSFPKRRVFRFPMLIYQLLVTCTPCDDPIPFWETTFHTAYVQGRTVGFREGT